MKIILSKAPNDLKWPRHNKLSIAEGEKLLKAEMATRDQLPPKQRDRDFNIAVVSEGKAWKSGMTSDRRRTH